MYLVELDLALQQGGGMIQASMCIILCDLQSEFDLSSSPFAHNGSND